MVLSIGSWMFGLGLCFAIASHLLDYERASHIGLAVAGVGIVLIVVAAPD